MFEFLIKKFVKNNTDTEDVKVRESYGKLTGITGIILNIILCISKILAGLFTGAISLLSDGINNLSDAGSSIITLVGFKLSSKKPDKDHPYGHGRMEYFAGLAVSAVIIFVAVQLLTESIGKITANEVPDYSNSVLAIATIAVLCMSIVIKLWMFLFNRYVGKKINSVAMQATALDSISDCVSTTVVLICALISMFLVKDFSIDGIAGVVVSLFIGYTGVKSVKEIVDLLLGKAPEKELVDEIADYVENYSEYVVGIHDLMMHDYGPGRKILILHVEVPAEENVLKMHDMIDNIEHGLGEKFNCIATIHMDPVITKNQRVTELKDLCKNIVKSIDADFTLHDFRMNEGKTHANLIFDVVITHETPLTAEEINKMVNERLREYDDKLKAIIKVEYSFV